MDISIDPGLTCLTELVLKLVFKASFLIDTHDFVPRRKLLNQAIIFYCDASKYTYVSMMKM